MSGWGVRGGLGISVFKGIEIVDFVDPGPRGIAVRGVLAAQPAAEPLCAPGHFAVELMSGLNTAANRPDHPFQTADLTQAFQDGESFEILISAGG